MCIYPNVTFDSGFREAKCLQSAILETVEGFLSTVSYSHTLTRETLLGERSFLLYRRLREISCCLRIVSVTTSFSVWKYQTLPPVTDLFLPIFKCLPHFFWRNCKRFLNGTNAILKFDNLASRCIFFRFLFALQLFLINF